MKITTVRFTLCRSPLARPLPLACGVLTHRNFGLVEIETDAGVNGWGETSVNFPPWCAQERRATIEEGLAGLLLGETPLEVGRLWQKMIDATRSFTRIWAEGAILQAIGGIDQALWDIAGRDYGVPVWQLLGGRHRETADLYAVGFRSDDPAAGAREAVAAGYRTIKIRAGFDDDRDLVAARAVRAALGDDVAIMIDANQSWTWPRARRMIARLREIRPFWIEEPLLSDDLDGYCALRRDFPEIALAWGENGFLLEDHLAFCRARAVDFVMPDPCRAGGLTQCTAIVQAAGRAGIPFSPHHYGSDLGFAATLHLVASQPNFAVMLRDVAPLPLRDEILDPPLAISGGAVRIPAGPGLGVTVNRKVVEAHRVAL